jgi:hypothetical protein
MDAFDDDDDFVDPKWKRTKLPNIVITRFKIITSTSKTTQFGGILTSGKARDGIYYINAYVSIHIHIFIIIYFH